MALDWLDRDRGGKPWSLFFAHKAVHPDAQQAADGTFGISTDGGYIAAERHRHLYRDALFPKTPNMLSAAAVIQKALDAGERERAMRWLGFAQGVLWAHGIYAVNELREQNRAAVRG